MCCRRWRCLPISNLEFSSTCDDAIIVVKWHCRTTSSAASPKSINLVSKQPYKHRAVQWPDDRPVSLHRSARPYMHVRTVYICPAYGRPVYTAERTGGPVRMRRRSFIVHRAYIYTAGRRINCLTSSREAYFVCIYLRPDSLKSGRNGSKSFSRPAPDQVV